ncbi:Fructosamine kinase-domain-containing protein [Xylariomycetidae sp. FL2044]|nr:Fructosamine kinase-domain-containing protein [Xylariomycetidae sp. FL2044]
MSVRTEVSSAALSVKLAELNLSQVIQQPDSKDEGGVLLSDMEATLARSEQNQTALIKDAKLLVAEDFDALGRPTEAWWTMMPDGTEIISINPHGNSSWSQTAEIQTELHGKLISYFIKATDYRSGMVMYRSEFESLKAMHEALPGICPSPIGWGHYASNPSVNFLLCHFLDISNESADPDLLPPRIAELHHRARSPDSLYGWHVPMAGGQLPIMVAKSASWEDFFARYMRYIFRAEEVAQGPRPPKIERLANVLFDRIIPRLLRPLETGGRTIIPRLLHTDLWSGNLGKESDGSAIIFDPMSMYGHNEFDLGVWNNPRQKLGMPFINNYHKFFPKSAPEEDQYGRNVLYTLAFEVRVAATKVGNPLYRNEMIRYMTDLETRYPESYEEWARARGEKAYPPKVASGLKWPH